MQVGCTHEIPRSMYSEGKLKFTDFPVWLFSTTIAGEAQDSPAIVMIPNFCPETFLKVYLSAVELVLRCVFGFVFKDRFVMRLFFQSFAWPLIPSAYMCEV